MAYTPKTWECGEIVTAAGLNNLEEGVQEALECCSGGGGVSPLIVNAHYDADLDQIIVDKTFGEIRTAVASGRMVVVIFEMNNGEWSRGIYAVIDAVDYRISETHQVAEGDVESSLGVLSVELLAPPYTLAALDALYPYTNAN